MSPATADKRKATSFLLQKPGLYVHVPFCRNKCPYCDFYSIASTSFIHNWLKALNREIHKHKDIFDSFDTLYIGGGTPSFLEEKALQTIFELIFDNCHVMTDSEITIEANPCDLDHKKINTLKNLNINRISLGVQSFNDDILRFLGRMHNAGQALKAFYALRDAGFKNIGIDLMYGMPGQLVSEWLDVLKLATELQPEHISCYQLTISDKTLFYKLEKDGKLFPISENEEATFFIETSRFLEDNGYIHYEISNFAKSRNDFSKHNVKYWKRLPYLGLGPSAHSFNKESRWWNIRSVKEYCQILDNEKTPVEDIEYLEEMQIKLERITLGLRTMFGFNADLINNDPGLAKKLTLHEEAGLITLKNNMVIPTKKGYLVADQLALDLSE